MTSDAALLQRAERARCSQDTRPVAWTWESDAALELCKVSPDMAQQLGYAPDALLGVRLDALTATSVDAQRLGAHLLGRLAFEDLALLLSHGDGTPGLFHLCGTAIVCPTSGGFLGYRGEGRELQDPAAREATLRRLIESTEAANRAKRDFIANMSHELRTPLNAIIGFTELTAGESFGPLGDARYRDYAEFTLESARHLLQLINDLLDVARIEAGKLVLEEDELDPAELNRGVLRIVAERCHDSLPQMHSEPAETLPTIRADERKLKQILLNLLSNAIKFTPSGGGVRLSAQQLDDGAVCFVVEDSGRGIAPQDIATAFTPFGQVKCEQGQHPGGSGLGLPLSKALAELHGGTLTLESELGRGTRVTLRLPAWRSLSGDAP